MATSQPVSRRSSLEPYHNHSHSHLHNTVSPEPTTATNTTSAVRRESRLHNWISEQCHLMVQDMGMEMGGGEGGDGSEADEPPLFSASTYVPVAQRVKAGAAGALTVDTTTAASTVNHKKTDSAVSAASSSSSSGHAHAAAVVASANGNGSANNLSGGWYWRTSGSSSGGSSEQDSLLASYILPSHPHSGVDSDVVVVGEEMIGEEDVDVDARSDSPLLGFGSDSDEEGGASAAQQQPHTHEQYLKIHRRSNSSEFMMDFPRTPGPEDMDSAFLTLSPPTPKQVLPLRSPPRDRLRYPKKGYRRDLPSGLEDGVRHNYPSMSPQRIHSPSSKMHSATTPPPRYGYSTTASREDEVTTPVPHRGSPMSAHQHQHQQQRNSISPTTSPSLIPSSPSLFPSSSLSSYPSVTSLSSLHSQGQPIQQQQQVPPLQPSLSRPSLQSLQQQQHVSPQHSPQLSSRPHSLSLPRKPSLARKPSFPLLKEVKEEEVDVDGAAIGPLPDTPPHDILKHERMETEDYVEGDHHQQLISGTESMAPSSASPPAVPSTPAMTTTALELLTLSPTGTEDTVTSASGTSSSGSTTSTIVPTAITTNAMMVTAGRLPVSSRMRSQSASVVTQLQLSTANATATANLGLGQGQGYASSNANAHGYTPPHHAHSFSYSGSGSGSGSGIGSPLGFGGSSSSAAPSAPSASTTVSPMSPAVSAVLSPSSSANNSAAGTTTVTTGGEEGLQLEEWSFPAVPPPRLSRASLGLGLGPGVGVRTQTRSRSGSDANLLSFYSITPGFRTPPGTSILSAVGTPSSSGRVVSEVEGGAGTRHAVYIVDSEEVSRRLGELLVDRNSVLLSSAAGHANNAEDEDEEDDLEDWESRRRTVVAVTSDAVEEEGEEESRGAQPGPVMEEVQEHQQQQPQAQQRERVQADPVLPLGDLFSPRRPAPLVHSASMPVVPQYSIPSPTGTESDSRPVTPPPSLGHRSSYSVGTMVNVTPTRKAPYPPATPRRQWTVTGADGEGSPVLGPPNTPATATELRVNGGSFGIYASPYASSSQIYLGPMNGSGSPSAAGHSREGSGSRSKEHSRSPSKSSSSNSNSSLKSHSRSSSKAHSRSPSVKSASIHHHHHHPNRYSGGPLSSPPLPALPSSPPLPSLPPSSSPSVHVVQPLMDAAPILTKADLARRLGPPPKRPPPAPPLDLGLDVGMLAGLNGAFRFPSPVPSPGAASTTFNTGGVDEDSARRLSRRSMLSEQEEREREREAEEERREYAYRNSSGFGNGYHERGESGEMMMEHDEEIEALRREMGFDRDLDDRHHHLHLHQQQQQLEDEELGILTSSHHSSRRTSGYLGEQEDTLRAHHRPSLHVNVRGSKRWSVDSVVLKDLPPMHAASAGAGAGAGFGPLSPPLPPIPQSAPIVHADHQRRHQRYQAAAAAMEVEVDVQQPPKIERSMSYFDDDDSENEDDLEDPDVMPMMGMAMMGVSVGGMMGVGAGLRSARRKRTNTTAATTTSSNSGNGMESVKSRRGWGRRSRDDSKKDESKDKASKSAPSSPVATRKSREEKRKSFGRGDGNVGGVDESSGKSRGRLASFFSKLAGSSSAAASSASPSTANSSPSTYSPSNGAHTHERKSLAANASEPDLRSTNGAWEALPSERVPPVPPMPPLHTLPRMESKTSLRSFSSRSRRATMVSQQWDDEENYGNVISPGTGIIGNSVPPTPSSLASGFSLTAGTSPRESLASSVLGGASPIGLAPALRTSRSVSNLNLLVNRGGIQELNAGASGWVVSPPATPGMEHGFNVPSEHASATLGSPQGGVLRRSDDSGASLPPPPVPPKDVSQGGAHEWPPSPSLPSIPGSATSSTGHFPHGISAVNGSGNGVVMNQDKARDRMMVRLRLKSSPSLGSLRTAQQQSQSGKKLRNFAARMMGKEEYA